MSYRYAHIKRMIDAAAAVPGSTANMVRQEGERRRAEDAAAKAADQAELQERVEVALQQKKAQRAADKEAQRLAEEAQRAAEEDERLARMESERRHQAALAEIHAMVEIQREQLPPAESSDVNWVDEINWVDRLKHATLSLVSPLVAFAAVAHS